MQQTTIDIHLSKRSKTKQQK
ncbi:conserved hypothetical protein [Prevotella intermedia]|uniref:Uncharacterized protein n=1 Tax=Prevotella intermedia TaxID=28131 RepID=A0A0S3UKA8_PREIN|nr:conserved hypothetical protein [Prevotella intermedia]